MKAKVKMSLDIAAKIVQKYKIFFKIANINIASLLPCFNIFFVKALWQLRQIWEVMQRINHGKKLK
jgi:hypothetical protein